MSELKESLAPITISSTVGCLSSIILTPFETIKTITQLRYQGTASKATHSIRGIIQEIVQQEGLRGLLNFYNSLDLTIIEATVSCGVRIGLFRYIKQEKKKRDNKQLNFLQKTIVAMVTGALGGAITTPVDIISLQVSARQDLPKWKRPIYRNFIIRMSEIVKEQGLAGLYRGTLINVIRTTAVNTAQLVCYHTIVEQLGHIQQGSLKVKVLGSFFSGLTVAVICLPFDNIRTKLLTMTKSDGAVAQYSGIADCFGQTIKKQGIKRLWSGFGAYCMTMGIYSMVTVLTQDVVWNWYMKTKRIE